MAAAQKKGGKGKKRRKGKKREKVMGKVESVHLLSYFILESYWFI